MDVDGRGVPTWNGGSALATLKWKGSGLGGAGMRGSPNDSVRLDRVASLNHAGGSGTTFESVPSGTQSSAKAVYVQLRMRTDRISIR